MKARLPRVVLDTNIVVSAVLKRDGLESRILRAALDLQVRLYVSLPILSEYAEVLGRPKFRLSANVRREIVEGVRSTATAVVPRNKILVCSDPDDDYVSGMR